MSPDLRGSRFKTGDIVGIVGSNYIGRVESISYGIRQSEDEYKISGIKDTIRQDKLESRNISQLASSAFKMFTDTLTEGQFKALSEADNYHIGDEGV